MPSFLRTLIICSGLLFLSFSEGFSAITFVPATNIYMTGTTADVRFDVASAISDSGSTVLPPHLYTPTKSFSGAFYLSGAGWVQFDTGSYMVTLDCGSQSLDSLTANCKLSGSGYSETIGEVGFSGADYIPTSGTLSGSMTSLFGNFSLDTVYLPLLPAVFTDMTESGVVRHDQSFLIAQPGKYNSTAFLWSIKFTPVGTSFGQTSSNILSSVDLSLASKYDVEITDPSGSKTGFSYEAYSDALSESLIASGPYNIQTFCNSMFPLVDARCPDGKTLKSTSLVNSPNSAVADGQTNIDFTLRMRDKYGNPIQKGNIVLSYSTDTRSIPPEATGIYGPSNFLDVLKHSGSFPLTSGFFDGVATYSGTITTDTLTYSIAARVPVDSLKLTTLTINGVPASGISSEVSFTPFFAINSFAPSSSDVRIGTGITFDVSMAYNSSRNDISPNVTHILSIGDNIFATFSSYQKLGSIICEANQLDMSTYNNECDWSLIGTKILPSVFVAEGAPTYSFIADYTPIFALAYVPPEPMYYTTYIRYDMDGATLIYPSKSDDFDGIVSSFQDRRVRILGQSQNANDWYSGVIKGGSMRADFFNKLHKNSNLLSRNRKDYSDVEYTVYTGSIEVTDSSFDSKRTIVVIGGDITITGSTIQRRNHPLSIIALTKDGIGGDIHIASGVTDISASLLSEKSVFSTGSNQLYINGSLISSNTMGQSDAVICPYYITPCVNPDIYDIEKFRRYYLTLPPGDKPAHQSTMSTPKRYPDTSLIIEYDSRIISDPPPVLTE